MTAPDDQPPVDQPPVDQPPVDQPVVDQPPVDEPVVDEPIDQALLEFLGFDLDEAAAWWLGPALWPSPLRVLRDDLVLRGVTSVEELTDQDCRRLKVADQVADVQEGHRRRFIAGRSRAGGRPRRHHDERRV